jgi:hypothetical protein
VADATAAGYKMSTVYVPCIGAHYTNTSLVAEFNPSTPSELLYEGTDPTSKIVGLSYLLYHPGGPPEGFAGPNDVWHGHSFNGGLCMKDGVVVGGERTSPEECEKRGGKKAPLRDIWMVHDWVAPGWECSWGVFAAECPELGGAFGAGPWAEPAKRCAPRGWYRSSPLTRTGRGPTASSPAGSRRSCRPGRAASTTSDRRRCPAWPPRTSSTSR